VQPKPPATVFLDSNVLGKSHQEHLLATRRFDRHELSGAVQLALYVWQTPWFRKYCHIIQTATGTCIDYDEAFEISIWITSPDGLAQGLGGVVCATVTRVHVTHYAHSWLDCK
jgi:hypothetical protein